LIGADTLHMVHFLADSNISYYVSHQEEVLIGADTLHMVHFLADSNISY